MPVPLPLVASGRTGSDLTVAGQDDGALVRRTVLPGGVRVLTERMPGVRSVSVGAWVGVGSRDELGDHHGSTHFLEHLLFKGTARRTAMDIAVAFDAVGGEANAATSHEHTCYYARVLDEDLPMAVDVLLDMVAAATIDPEELESERGVILEELAMNEDDPTDLAHERLTEVVLAGHPLGRPIGGTPEAIERVPRAAVHAHYREHYVPQGLVVTAAGGVDHDRLCTLVLEALTVAGWPLDADAVPLPRRSGAPAPLGPPAPELVVVRPVEQVNVLLGCTGLTVGDPRRWTLSVLTAALGGGMSSRLFQEVRERRGLAYSTYAFSSSWSDAGLFGLYAGCSPARTDEVAALLAQQWEALAADGLGEEELERGKGQLRGGIVLGMEDSMARMNRLGSAELVRGEHLSLEEVLARVGAVDAAGVQALTAELAARPRTRVQVGPLEDVRG